jgi:hypothetical protein
VPQPTNHPANSALQESGIVASVCAALKEAAASSRSSGSSIAGSSSSSSSSGLIAALTAALLECSSSRELCTQQLHAGVLPVLAELLQAEAAIGLQGSLCSTLTELLWNLAAASQLVQGNAVGNERQRQQPSASPTDQQQEQPQPRSGGVAEGLVAALTAVVQLQGVAGASLQVHRDALRGSGRHKASYQASVLMSGWCCPAVSRMQVKQQRNDTLTVLCHLSACRPCVPAMVGNGGLLQLLLEAAAGMTCASSSGSSSGSPLIGGTAGKAASTTTSNERSIEVDHCMLLLVWTTLGNMAAASAPGLEALLQAGLLHLLLSAAEHGRLQSCAGCTAGSSASAAVLAWWARLTAQQLAASQQLAWSLLQQVGACAARQASTTAKATWRLATSTQPRVLPAAAAA